MSTPHGNRIQAVVQINKTSEKPRPIVAVAPMMEWTDRHCRYFLRLISRHALLYTEMVTAAAVVHGDRDHLLAYHPDEHPLALQLGGSNPLELAQAARIAAGFGYDEINLNVGCPSNRVQSGRFGACLMLEPSLVGDCVAAMSEAVDLPVTVKCRIGVDDRDSYDELCVFADTVFAADCRALTVHARKAWLTGLSPRENREIPPLRHDVVHRLKRDFPDRVIVLNGGLETVDDALRHLGGLDGVMFGRAAYHDPYMLAAVDGRIFGDNRPSRSRAQIVTAMTAYANKHVRTGGRVHQVSRHMLGLFHGQAGARRWRRFLGENAVRRDKGGEVLSEALDRVFPSADRVVSEALR